MIGSAASTPVTWIDWALLGRVFVDALGAGLVLALIVSLGMIGLSKVRTGGTLAIRSLGTVVSLVALAGVAVALVVGFHFVTTK
jgi:hypothetical protein